MLYISTRNPADTYTAYRALHESTAPDGGQYVPFHLPVFTREELIDLKRQSFSETVAQILNLFFGLSLTDWDVESAIGRAPVKLKSVGQRLIVGEMWHNPDGDCGQIFNRIYKLMCQSDKKPDGWVVVAIKIALLFAICSTAENSLNQFDIATKADDFSDITAAIYCEAMGLPIHLLIFACDENSSIWNLVNKGEYFTGGYNPKYLESFIFKYLGVDQLRMYLNAIDNKATYYMDEVFQQLVIEGLFASVVSDSRADTVISSIRSANQYTLDNDSALAYGALQDYRACMGVSNQTLILSKKRPATAKE